MAKVINAVFGGGLFATTAKVFQYDVGDKLRFLGVDLPDGYSVDFANSRTGASTTVYGDADGVAIPPEYFIPGTEIYAWVVISDADGHYTRYQAKIPIYERAARSDVEPTPAQTNALDEAINAINGAATYARNTADEAMEIAQSVRDAADAGDFDGAQGNSAWYGGEIRVAGTTPYYYTEDLSGRTDVEPIVGDLIVSNVLWLWQIKRISGHIIYIASRGNLKGSPGEAGFSPTVAVTEITGGHRVTITDEDGDHVFDVLDGQGGGGDGEVFFAIYGLTTSAEIEEAYQNGKAIFCINGQVILPLTVRVDDFSHSFSGCAEDILWIINCDSDTWSYTFDTVYSKPSGGIPASDLTGAVQTSLGKADTALQSAPVSSVNGQTGAVSLSIPSPSNANPYSVNYEAFPGVSTEYARADHVHNLDLTYLDSCISDIYAVNIPVFLYDGNNGVYIRQRPQDLASAYQSQTKLNFALVVPPDYDNYPVLFTPSKFDTATGELHLTGIVGGVLYEATLLPGADPTGQTSNTVMVGTMTTTNLALPSAQGVSF